jgi:uncharacterized protein involved in oxidation of intracellular sulfur
MKLFYLGTHGPEDPTKACLPFHLAVNGVVADIEAEIGLTGDAVVLVRQDWIETLVPVGFSPLKQLVDNAITLGIPIYV